MWRIAANTAIRNLFTWTRVAGVGDLKFLAISLISAKSCSTEKLRCVRDYLSFIRYWTVGALFYHLSLLPPKRVWSSSLFSSLSVLSLYELIGEQFPEPAVNYWRASLKGDVPSNLQFFSSSTFSHFFPLSLSPSTHINNKRIEYLERL